MIRDSAEQTDADHWATQAILELGVAAPTLAEAVFARSLSALKTERVAAANIIQAQTLKPNPAHLAPALPDALLAAKICVYAQGFAALRCASDRFQWSLPLATISRIWRGGCVIRTQLLTAVETAFSQDAQLSNLLLDPYLRSLLEQHQLALRRVVATAVAAGVPVPALSSALHYFDAYRSSRLPTHLIQAQRDYVAAHPYERLDKTGQFHTDWTGSKT